jgi:hypothetical protein
MTPDPQLDNSETQNFDQQKSRDKKSKLEKGALYTVAVTIAAAILFIILR